MTFVDNWYGICIKETKQLRCNDFFKIPAISLLFRKTKAVERTEKELRSIYFIIDMVMQSCASQISILTIYIYVQNKDCWQNWKEPRHVPINIIIDMVMHSCAIQTSVCLECTMKQWKYNYCQWDVHWCHVNKRRF